MTGKDQMIEDYSEDDDDSAERAAAYQEWQQARTPRQGPFPQLLICEKGEDCDEEHEHNPFPGYEDHVYLCECDGCLKWYQSLG